VMEFKLRRCGEPEGVGHPHQWDPETGDLSGQFAAAIKTEARFYQERDGCITTESGYYTEKDPLHDNGAMGILLAAMNFHIPAELIPFVPEPNYKYDPEAIY